MGDTTVVDTEALDAAGHAAAVRAQDVRGRAGASGAALALLAAELAGARSGAPAAELRRASGTALGGLADALGRFGDLLAGAAAEYRQAEAAAVPPAPAPRGQG